MIFQPIASSSQGNAYLVSDGDSRILLDCGVPFKRLQAALDYAVHELDGCLLTHEHKDHAGHVEKLLKRGVDVYATPGTIRALELEDIHPLLMIQGSTLGAPLRLGSFVVVPFRVFHDAAEPVGYMIRDSHGDKLAFATDTVGLGYRFPGINIFAVEANYKDEILARNTRLPESVVKRVRNSHMEIDTLREFLARQDLSDCREIWLLHLSNASSNEGLFVELVERTVGPGIVVRAAAE